MVLVLFVLCVALLWESFYFHVSSCLFSCCFFCVFCKNLLGSGRWSFCFSLVCSLCAVSHGWSALPLYVIGRICHVMCLFLDIYINFSTDGFILH